MSQQLLRVENIKKHFPIKKGILSKTSGYIRAVDGVTFELQKSETIGIVGESGCGKSTLAQTILLLTEPTSGNIFFKNNDILKFNKTELLDLRKKMQIVFQDPYDSLNSYHNIGQILDEPYKIHKIGSKHERRDLTSAMLEKVGLSPNIVSKYPHEFSGGQRQRIGIARALSLNPELIICDEPVSSLDVSVQAQILNLLMNLQKEFNLSYIFISHNLSVVKLMSDYILVMYLGKVVESADPETIYNNPCHPYTKLLIDSIPEFGKKLKRENNAVELQSLCKNEGCVFADRCPDVIDECRKRSPELLEIGGNGIYKHKAACLLAK